MAQTEGLTTHGSHDSPVRCAVRVETPAIADSPSCLVLEAVDSAGARVPYWIWVDSTGDLRIHTALPTDEDGDGTVVGAQTA